MKNPLSIPALKRRARLIAREEGIAHHRALDRVAAAQGFRSWSLLAASRAGGPPPAAPAARALHAALAPGDILLVGARPGQGKTLLGLRLAVEAMRAGHRAVFFSLEYAERDVDERFRAIGVDRAGFGDAFAFDGSDAISAGHVVDRLGDAPARTLAVIDYLQLLDQRRDKPDLAQQVGTLRAFARRRGLNIVFISQIDRGYDPSRKPFPDLGDVRLPNPLDLSLFDRACFLNAGAMRLSPPVP